MHPVTMNNALQFVYSVHDLYYECVNETSDYEEIVAHCVSTCIHPQGSASSG